MPAAGAKVFQCNQLLLVGLPFEKAMEVGLSSCPRIDVKSLERISRSGRVYCSKWLSVSPFVEKGLYVPSNWTDLA